MSTVKKETLDNAIRVSRKFWNTGDADYLGTRHKIVVLLSEQAFGKDFYWSELEDIIDSSIKLPIRTKNEEAPNELIYSVFELLGITVEAA